MRTKGQKGKRTLLKCPGAFSQLVSARLDRLQVVRLTDTERQEPSTSLNSLWMFASQNTAASAGIMKTRGPMILPDCVDPQQRPVTVCVVSA